MTKQKTETKEVVGLTQGAYDSIELVPTVTKTEAVFNEMVEALNKGKFYVMRVGYTKNSVYTTIHKLEEKANIKASYAQTKTVVDGKEVSQFVLFRKKE
jgi:hypothetical protein